MGQPKGRVPRRMGQCHHYHDHEWPSPMMIMMMMMMMLLLLLLLVVVVVVVVVELLLIVFLCGSVDLGRGSRHLSAVDVLFEASDSGHNLVEVWNISKVHLLRLLVILSDFGFLSFSRRQAKRSRNS